jgi:hypothetical protein
MKKLVSILTVMLVAVVLLSACKKDGEDARDKFVGTYNVSCTLISDVPGIPTNYVLTISKSSLSSYTISLENIHNSGQSVSATVAGTAIAINLQQTVSGKPVTGAGTLVKNVLTFNTTYNISGSEETESWQHVATKQ